MSRYSSESESSRGEDSYRRRKHSGRNRGRSRSSSYSSSDSHYSSKKRSYKHKRSKGHRSRSRDKYSKSRSRHVRASDDGSHSSLRSRSSSKVKSNKSSKDRSRSSSDDRSRYRRSRRCSRSRGRNHSRSRSSSRGKSRSRSPSQSSRDSRTQSQSGSAKQEPSSEEQLRVKLQKAIRAAQCADDQLRQQGLLTGISSRKEDITRVSEPSSTILDEINSQNFIQKQFTSSRTTEQPSPDTAVVVDLTSEVAHHSVPQGTTIEDTGSIFHSSLFGNPEHKLDKWVKRLFHLRQKAINGEPIA